MVKNISNLTFLIMAIISFIGFACNDEKPYNWENIDPGTQLISGPDTIYGNAAIIDTFLARPRGGSKFEWTVISGPATISANAEKSYIGELIATSEVDTIVEIQVTETTYGGKVAVSNKTIRVLQFCPYSISQLIGNGNFVSTDICLNPSEPNTPIATLRPKFSILNGDTVLCNYFFEFGWVVKFVLNSDPKKIEINMIPKTFEYNNDIVTVNGKGTYNTCKRSITVNYAVTNLFGDTIPNGLGKIEYKQQ
jgi:hypothetical protein